MKDLYSFVNGPWLAHHVIPADRAIDGTFHKLRDQAEAEVHEIITADNGLAGRLFASFLDVPAIEAAGITPIAAELARISAVASLDELIEVFGELERTGVGAPLTFWVAKDSNAEQAVAYLVQSGLGLPDEAYYHDVAHAETLAAYHAHVARMLGFVDSAYLGGLSAEQAAERILALESELAAGHWDVVATRDAVKTYNPTELSSLPAPVANLLRASGMPEHRAVAMMPSFNEHLAGLLTAERLADWRLWAVWHVLHSRAHLLSQDIDEANFDFYGRTLSGTLEQRDRWKRGVRLAENLVGMELGRIFVAKHFPPAAKDKMVELVGYLIDAYRERISTLAWMTPDTRDRALAKLDLFRAKIGYPEQWRSFVGLEFSASGADVVANVRAGAAFNHDYELAKIGRPADRDEWFSTPQTVNAFYNPVVNDITFPAAILRPPFFDAAADAAENFGAIGAIIGHEIGHGFDDQGSQYDGYGNLRSWWSDEDRAAFEKLTSRLVEQFQGLVPTVLAGTDSAGVNGQFTLGENIGDLGGLGIAVVAYRRYLAAEGKTFADTEARPFVVEEADPELATHTYNGLQRLFLAWARGWRTAIRPELATQFLAIDPHSPAEFRCNVIAANIPEFYQAFPEIGEDSPMYLAPEERVSIW